MCTVEYGSELPASIIHRIQSLLTPQTASQTTLLSKSWQRAWSTRPALDLDESHFRNDTRSWSSRKIDALTEFASKTFRKYEEFNVKKIDTFRLCVETEWYGLSGLATRWTLKALEMGATDLTFRLNSRISVPIDEVFRSENVVRLCLQHTDINQLEVIKCSGLKSLTLVNMKISSDSFFDILSCCPLIENLSFYNISSHYSGQKTIPALHKLTSLLLFRVGTRFKTLFLDDLSSKFPNLKDLTLRLSSKDLAFLQGEEEVQIVSSLSLEILNFRVDDDDDDKIHRVELGEEKMVQRVEFDVPSIRKFTLEGEYMPKLSFSPKSGDQWESRVSLTRTGELSTTWFLKLSELLAELTRSKIHLFLNVYYGESFDYPVGDIEVLNLLEVEDLTMDTHSLPSLSFNALLDGLFRICRPKTITQYCDAYSCTRNNDLFLCRALEEGMKVRKLLIRSQYMYGLRDLEEVNAWKSSDGVWKPLPLDSIFDDPQGRFRLELKWMETVLA